MVTACIDIYNLKVKFLPSEHRLLKMEWHINRQYTFHILSYFSKQSYGFGQEGVCICLFSSGVLGIYGHWAECDFLSGEDGVCRSRWPLLGIVYRFCTATMKQCHKGAIRKIFWKGRNFLTYYVQTQIQLQQLWSVKNRPSILD